TARITDFWGVIPAITGKVELVYEGEQEGSYAVAVNLMGKAIKKMFLNHFPDPEKLKKGQERDPYGTIKAWFSGGNELALLNDNNNKTYKKTLDSVAGLKKLVESTLDVEGDELYLYMELVLHGLAEFNIVSKDLVDSQFTFRDLLAGMLDDEDMFGDFDDF
ncbi:MAG: magnesium chelatase, partial [Bacteroidota bacterium]